MELENSVWLWLLIPTVLLIVIWLVNFRGQWRDLNKHFNVEHLSFLLPGFLVMRKYIGMVAIGFSFCFMVLALTNPRTGVEREAIISESVNLLLAIDMSLSMLVEDRSPNRMEVAKQRAIELIDAMPGNRFAFLPFAGLAERQLPFTSDRSALKMTIRSASAGMMPVQGTSFAQLLSEAADYLSETGSGVLVIISDGETHDDAYDFALEKLKENNFPVFTIGIGTEQGAPIPATVSGRQDIRRDIDGNVVISRMETDLLRELAFQTGGGFISNPGIGAMEQLAEQISSFGEKGIAQGSFQVYRDYYPWLILTSLLLLLIYRLLPVFKTKEIV